MRIPPIQWKAETDLASKGIWLKLSCSFPSGYSLGAGWLPAAASPTSFLCKFMLLLPLPPTCHHLVKIFTIYETWKNLSSLWNFNWSPQISTISHYYEIPQHLQPLPYRLVLLYTVLWLFYCYFRWSLFSLQLDYEFPGCRNRLCFLFLLASLQM